MGPVSHAIGHAIHVFRTYSRLCFPLMILAHVILSGAFVWIYARGAEAKPWLLQGVRFAG